MLLTSSFPRFFSDFLFAFITSPTATDHKHFSPKTSQHSQNSQRAQGSVPVDSVCTCRPRQELKQRLENVHSDSLKKLSHYVNINSIFFSWKITVFFPKRTGKRVSLSIPRETAVPHNYLHNIHHLIMSWNFCKMPLCSYQKMRVNTENSTLKLFF